MNADNLSFLIMWVCGYWKTSKGLVDECLWGSLTNAAYIYYCRLGHAMAWYFHRTGDPGSRKHVSIENKLRSTHDEWRTYLAGGTCFVLHKYLVIGKGIKKLGPSRVILASASINLGTQYWCCVCLLQWFQLDFVVIDLNFYEEFKCTNNSLL